MQLSKNETKSTFTAKITKDGIIIEIIKNGLNIDFQERPRMTNVSEILHSEKEKSIIDLENKKF